LFNTAIYEETTNFYVSKMHSLLSLLSVCVYPQFAEKIHKLK